MAGFLTSIVCAAGVAVLATPILAQPTIAVVEKRAGRVSFYDAAGERVGTVKTGKFPHEMAISPDKRFLYVSNMGLLWRTDPGAGENSITVIDLPKLAVVGAIDLSGYRRPHGIAVLPKTGELIVTIENPSGLLRIDPAASRVVRKYEVHGQGPHMVFLGPGAKTAWATNADTGDLSVVNLDSGEIEGKIPMGKNPQGGVLTRDGKRAFVTNTASNRISVIDVASRQVKSEIETGEGPARIALTPDGRTLIYNLQMGEQVGFADVKTLKETARVKLPGRPLSLSLSGDGRTAYLGIQDDDKVALVSVRDRRVVKVIDMQAGGGPDTVFLLR